MAARSSRRKRPAQRWGILLAAVAGLAVLLALLTPALVMGWVRGYLRDDAFRTKLEAMIGTRLAGSVSLAPLRWTGDEVLSRTASVETAEGWKAELTGLHLAVDWAAFRDRQWRLLQAGADSLDLTRNATSGEVGQGLPLTAPATAQAGPGRAVPGWLRAWLPDRFGVDGVRIDAFTFSHPGPWRLAGSALRVAPWQQGDASVLVTLENGVLETPVQLPTLLHPIRLNLSSATLRLAADEMRLSTASLTWAQGGEVTARGHLRPSSRHWQVEATLAGIPLAELLSPDWKLRLTGLIEGDLRVLGSAAAEPTVEGQVRLKNAALTALPLLNQLANFTRVERFKRLVLDVAEADVRAAGQTRRFEKVVVESAGLLRLEGDLTLQAGQMDGRFMLGVTPDALRWIPGAGQHVFTSSYPGAAAGMVWTPLRITGTVDAPQEDLTARILSGAGKALVDAPAQVLGKAGETLLTPVLGGDLAKKPGEVLKSATDAVSQPGEALKKAGEAAEKGIDLLKGIGGGLLGR